MFLTPIARVGHLAEVQLLTSLVVTVSAVLLHLVISWDPALVISRIGFCWMCLVAIPRFQTREWALALLSVALTSVLAFQQDGFARLYSALDLAAFFGAFIVLLTLMKEAAARSASVQKVGHFLTTQPTGRRYYATALGGHALGVFLNFAAVSLMAPLIQKGAEDPAGKINRNLERRQLSALLRGFSWFLLWAPTSLAQAVLLTLFPGVDLKHLLTLGLLTAALMVVLGRGLDRFEWRHTTSAAPTAAPGVPIRALGVVAGICAALIGSTFAISGLASFTIAQSLMLVAPTVTLAWFIAQGAPYQDQSSLIRKTRAFGDVVARAAPSLVRTGITLGLSGFIGRTAAFVLPTDEIALWLDLTAVPSWLFLASLPVIITIGGQIALSPILMVVFFGELLGQIPNLPADPTLIVYSLAFGWALSMSASPNATATLLISATSGIAPKTLTWLWNGKYALLCYAAFAVIVSVIA